MGWAGCPWRFVIDRVNHKDELACEVVLGKAGGSPEDVVERVRAAVRSGLRFAAQVRTVESLPDDEAAASSTPAPGLTLPAPRLR